MSFIKWMGGKSKVLHLFKDYFPDFHNVKGYIEPFLGGGSVFFYLKENGYLNNKPIYLSDINKELITAYLVVRDNLDELIPLLQKHQKFNSKEHFEDIKKNFLKIKDDIEIAADFIYLANNAFGGMWRVNSDGKFNSSYAGNEDIILVDDNIYECSKLLQDTDIKFQSFEKILDIKIDFKDFFCYNDPPYFNDDSVDGCYRYTKDQFCTNTRLNIPKMFKELDKRGCKVMMSNSTAPIVYQYFKYYNILEITTARVRIKLDNITKKNMNNAQKWSEVVVTNYPIINKQKNIDDFWI